MGTVDQWWREWAPYWENVEDRHLSALVTESFIDGCRSPVLVVGAGQGLVVEALRTRGFDVTGVDRTREMVSEAKRRRDLDILCADARSLPFAGERFHSVIISTGVLDYVDDPELIRGVLEESFRVLRRGGPLFAAFFQLPRPVEEALRGIGVIQGQEYHMGRLFELQAGVLHPLRGAMKIARWTRRSLLPTLVDFIRLGLSVPPELMADHRKTRAVFSHAEADGVAAEELRRSVPDVIPYRREREVRELFERAGFPCGGVEHHEDCLVAQCRRLLRRPARPRTYRRRSARESASWSVRTEEISKRYKGAATKAVDWKIQFAK